MFPPSQGLRLDIDAISQICGSVSIACWIVVFSPQIIENWRRSSADGLSVVFITIWLLGDFFNIFGAVMQGVLPTMIILAVYYTFADIVLLLQCFWYKGFTLKDEVKKPDSERTDAEGGHRVSEQSPLLANQSQTYASVVASSNGHTNGHSTPPTQSSQGPPRISDADRRHSTHSVSSLRERLLSIDGSHLSPVTPLLPDSPFTETHPHHAGAAPPRPITQTSPLQTVLFNFAIILLVVASGIFGWWLSATRSHHASPEPPSTKPDPTLHFNPLAQVFGYICALLYLGSRIPQLLLNYRRKSTEGISMLFFLFACIGNLTYVLSILAYQPRCKNSWGEERSCAGGEAVKIYWRYVGVNMSWLVGSFGTLLLDAGVFVQYFMYREEDAEEGVDGVDEAVGTDGEDARVLASG